MAKPNKKAMNKTFIKVIAIVLTLAMIIPFAVSCNNNSPDQTQNPDVTNQSEQDNDDSKEPEEEPRIYPDIPDVTYDGYNFRILSYSGNWAVRDMYAGAITEEPINDSVYTRNKTVEGDLNIKISEVSNVDAVEMARRSIASQLDEYDMICIPSTQQMTLALNGYLYPLDNLEYLDVEKPWWDKNAYDSLSVANTHYIIVGDIQIMDKDATWVQFFNKKMIEDYNLENPFDLVKSGDWTFEKQLEMVKAVTKDNGDSVLNENDTWGIVSTAFSPVGYFYGFGGRIATKNADDIPELTMNNPKISQMINYIAEVCNANSTQGFVGDSTVVQNIFQSDRALFLGEVLQLAERLREMDTDFGLIPTPKFDKSQENYYSLVHSTTCMLSVPATIADPQRNSIIMEALCAESRYTLRKAYYDTALTTKFLRYDDGSSEMLDIIFDNRVYDLGFINDWGGYFNGFKQLFQNNSTDFASMYAKNESAALKAIQKMVDSYTENAKK